QRLERRHLDVDQLSRTGDRRDRRRGSRISGRRDGEEQPATRHEAVDDRRTFGIRDPDAATVERLAREWRGIQPHVPQPIVPDRAADAVRDPDGRADRWAYHDLDLAVA